MRQWPRLDFGLFFLKNRLMVINLAPVSLSNKKVHFYTCPRLTYLKKKKKKKATENAYESISKPLDFKIFWGGGGGGTCP